ncbi:efflux RND transporter periplasmic adaptor subunit [Roseimaritima sediminicola]|uniref:efflux RND transporter periplasmic adaptor subunit n=1 Tax=Roseimaritima sediminicola TaxID=2662066 RepID=UPI00129824D2|nr:HlyD family efflux transporter periplasmic adaptor subunit [Roseimaritima sediminicola]
MIWKNVSGRRGDPSRRLVATGPVWLALATVSVLASSSGCSKPPLEYPAKAPRAVTTLVLRQFTPDSGLTISGSVSSWKTESIGFEVPGRVQWVLEPGKNVLGRVVDADGTVLQEGTRLAAIDPSQYEAAVDAAAASLEAAQLDAEIIAKRISDSIPADIRSAEADLNLAQTQLDRVQRLRQSNAASRSEYDDAQNRLMTQRARLDNLRAVLSQTEVELKAAQARIKAAEEELHSAHRDLDHTVLHAAYPGQVSDVQVVPGSVVSAGSPVLTLQMTTPIKVSIEVSAEQSRELERRRQLPVTFTQPDGTPAERNAMVYSVAPSADPTTRTFSVTLLIMNEQYRGPLPDVPGGQRFARTQDVWPLQLNHVIGLPDDILVVETGSIHHDDQGAYVYVLDNARFGQRLPDVLEVRKQRIEAFEAQVPFLGNWEFQPVRFLDQQGRVVTDVDRQALIASTLEYPEGDRRNWDGRSVVIDAGPQWMLRPGDLVRASLTSLKPVRGYFVPLEAIYEQAERTFVFFVENGVASQREVIAEMPEELKAGALVRILPTSEGEFPEGSEIVVRGVHYLMDGEAVRIVDRQVPPAEDVTAVAAASRLGADAPRTASNRDAAEAQQ